MPLYSTACPLPLNRKISRHRVSSAPAFSPADITGLSLWLKPDAGLNSLLGIVTGWTDQSGVGNNFSQDLNYLAYVEADIINGYDGVLFEGGRLNGSNDIETGKTIYAVVRTLGYTPEAYGAILECTGGSLYSAIADTEWGSYFNAGVSSYDSLAINTPAIIATLSDDGEIIEYRKNGTSILSGSYGEGFYSRSASYLGNDSGGGQPANVYISEIIVYNNVPSPANIALLETYLNTKYAIY
jgi:hypothetical protein